MNTIRFIPGLL